MAMQINRGAGEGQKLRGGWHNTVNKRYLLRYSLLTRLTELLVAARRPRPQSELLRANLDFRTRTLPIILVTKIMPFCFCLLKIIIEDGILGVRLLLFLFLLCVFVTLFVAKKAERKRARGRRKRGNASRRVKNFTNFRKIN